MIMGIWWQFANAQLDSYGTVLVRFGFETLHRNIFLPKPNVKATGFFICKSIVFAVILSLLLAHRSDQMLLPSNLTSSLACSCSMDIIRSPMAPPGPPISLIS